MPGTGCGVGRCVALPAGSMNPAVSIGTASDQRTKSDESWNVHPARSLPPAVPTAMYLSHAEEAQRSMHGVLCGIFCVARVPRSKKANLLAQMNGFLWLVDKSVGTL